MEIPEIMQNVINFLWYLLGIRLMQMEIIFIANQNSHIFYACSCCEKKIKVKYLKTETISIRKYLLLKAF